MDHINEHLATSAKDIGYSAAIHSALVMGKRTLNHYTTKLITLKSIALPWVSYDVF